MFKHVIKNWLPPIFLKLYRTIISKRGITFIGPYSSWDKAVSKSIGYDNHEILQKVLISTLKVKNSEAAYERDSVIFDEVQYSWPVTAGLMWVAAANGGRLSVLDFGGSLGSSYFQNRQFLAKLPIVRWSVVEQAHFVEAGLNHIQDEHLVFYPTITECVAVEKPNVVLLSSVLQYLEDPYTVLDELAQSGVNLIIIDRTLVNKSQSNMIFLQNVPKSIYEASYPVHSLSESQLLIRLDLAGFGLIVNFPSLYFPALDKIDADFRGYLFKKKS